MRYRINGPVARHSWIADNEGSFQMRLTILPTAFLSLVVASAYQGPAGQSQPEVSSRETPVTFSSRVNLVSVPVVVRDRNGHAVGNLRQEDFQVYDKGKLQTITKYTVEKTDSAAAPATGSRVTQPANTAASVTSQPALPERYVAFLFDDVQLPLDDLARARTAAIRMVNESFDPGTRAAIYTTSGHVTQDFTGDREKLAQTFNQIQPFPKMTGIPAGLSLRQLLPGLADRGWGSGGPVIGSNRLPCQVRPSQPTRSPLV